MNHRHPALVTAAIVTLAATGCSHATAEPTDLKAPTAHPNASDVWPVLECGTASGTGCAPASKRVDLVRPTFSHPTRITNPLMPESSIDTVVQVGVVDGKPFRSETTTLPTTQVVDWYGTKVEVVLSRYTAWLDGKIDENAIDRYAQADDGSVWYFGEDVVDYAHGTAFVTDGTWLAGRDGQPSMIMPAHPKVGDVYRVENITGVVFEELTVKHVGLTMPGPNGPVHGIIQVDEFGVDSSHSTKFLAPGYGEFLTRSPGELEAMAVATPVDSLLGGCPVEIRRILTAAWGTMEYARLEDWPSARFSTNRIRSQLALVRQTQQPPRVMALLERASRQLDAAVARHRVIATQVAAVAVAQATIDLESRYLDPLDVDVARFHLHGQALRVAASQRHLGAVTGEVAALEWFADRLLPRLDDAGKAILQQGLTDVRTAADARNAAAAADLAARLAQSLRNLSGGL